MFSIGAYAIWQSRSNASAVNVVTEGVVPSALASADLVSRLKDVQLGALMMVTASGRDVADQDSAELNKRKGLLEEAIELQLQQAVGDKQRGLVQQAQQSLKSYFDAIDEVVSFKLAGQKELAEASLSANVAGYQNELGAIVETLRVEKKRSSDRAIDELNDNLRVRRSPSPGRPFSRSSS